MLAAPATTPGQGRIHLIRSQPATPTEPTAKDNDRPASFAVLSFSYPLKLLSPRSYVPDLGAVYVLSYGGGLVGGDEVGLDVEVGDGASLVCLTQGSTKVFKTRPGVGRGKGEGKTVQTLKARIGHGSALYLLPAPVTCFADASYSQRQEIHLSSSTSSLVLLDWFTSGRMHLHSASEEWAFSRYRSANTVFLSPASELAPPGKPSDRLVVRDVLLLDRRSTVASISDLTRPYAVYGSLIIVAPPSSFALRLLTHFRRLSSSTSQRKRASPPSLIWSLSEIVRPTPVSAAMGETKVAIVRMAAMETDELRGWLQDEMENGGMKEALGMDLFRNAFVG